MAKGSQKPIQVKLEKAEERVQEEMPRKQPVAQVPLEIIEGIKSQREIVQEAAEEAQATADLVRYNYYKNKALFYLGVFAGVGILYLFFKYTKSKPDTKYVQEIVNNIATLP